jgi:hypothetical protein
MHGRTIGLKRKKEKVLSTENAERHSEIEKVAKGVKGLAGLGSTKAC